MKDKKPTENKPKRYPPLSRYAQDRIARLELLRDNDPGLTFADRDAIDWAIRLAEQQAQMNADDHESETFRNRALVAEISAAIRLLLGVLTSNYVTDDQLRFYENLGFKPLPSPLVETEPKRRKGARK